MRRARAILIAILLVGTAVSATAGDMVLTRNGELYRVAPTDEGLVVNHRFTDGTSDEYLIPQTSGVAATSLQVGVDELTGAIFVAWQRGVDADATIEMAWLAEDFHIDLALMPIGDCFTMGPEGSIRAANLINAPLTVPTHYNTFPLIEVDISEWERLMADAGHLTRVLAPGSSIELKD